MQTPTQRDNIFRPLINCVGQRRPKQRRDESTDDDRAGECGDLERDVVVFPNEARSLESKSVAMDMEYAM